MSSGGKTRGAANKVKRAQVARRAKGSKPAATTIPEHRQTGDLEISDPQQLIDNLNQAAPKCSSILLPPRDGYNYLYLAEQGVIAYQLIIGAFQYDHQRLLENFPELSAEQIAVINALYSENPEHSGRKRSIKEITALVNKDLQLPEELTEEQVSEYLQQLWDKGCLHWRSADHQEYCLSPDIDFAADDDQAPWLITYHQAGQLISELGLSGYYQFRGALLRARREGISKSANQQQEVLIERLYQLSLARGKEINPWQEFNIKQVTLQANPGQEELGELKAQLDDLAAQGLILSRDSGLGQLYSLPVNPPGIARSEQNLTASQLRNLSVYTPVQYWRSEGRLRQAARQAQRRCADDLFAQAVIGSIAVLSQEGREGAFPGDAPGSLDAQFASQQINDVLNKLGCSCSKEKLEEKLQQLSKDGLVTARNTGVGPDLPMNYSLAVNDLPGKADYLQPEDCNPDKGPRLAQRLRRRTPSGYYFRCGQVLEARASIRQVGGGSDFPQIIKLLTDTALDADENVISAERLLSAEQNNPRAQKYLDQLVEEGLVQSWVDKQLGRLYRLTID